MECLLQLLSRSAIVDELSEHTSAQMRKALSVIIKASPAEIEDQVWAIATLPLRMGGFGFRDPKIIARCARLAAVVNVTDLAVEMGAAESHMASELEAAVALYMAKLELLVRPELPVSKELQKHLTVPLHMRTTDQLVRNADPITKARLESLLTPHSTAWLVCTPLFRVLAPPETVAGTGTWASNCGENHTPAMIVDVRLMPTDSTLSHAFVRALSLRATPCFATP